MTDPWAELVFEAPLDEPDLTIVELDLDAVRRRRRELPLVTRPAPPCWPARSTASPARDGISEEPYLVYAAAARVMSMIMRYWRGWTAAGEDADRYQALLIDEVLPSIAARAVAGYLGSYVLRRDIGDEVEFAVVMQFKSIAAVRDFAGDDHERAYVPPDARAVLRRFDERAVHYETLRIPEQTRSPRGQG